MGVGIFTLDAQTDTEVTTIWKYVAALEVCISSKLLVLVNNKSANTMGIVVASAVTMAHITTHNNLVGIKVLNISLEMANASQQHQLMAMLAQMKLVGANGGKRGGGKDYSRKSRSQLANPHKKSL